MRIIAVNTGEKFGEWYVDNLKHMIDKYSGLKYDTSLNLSFNKLIKSLSSLPCQILVTNTPPLIIS